MTNSENDSIPSVDDIRQLLHVVAAMPRVRRQPHLVERVAAAQRHFDSLSCVPDNPAARLHVSSSHDSILRSLQEVITSAKCGLHN
ncbi:hypothetical protein [Mycolicibacterium mageritense]|uniref:hypothetical protein n=1 Tax=Mycolicibacterium mageritense TaxID=53462 RepID=UPI001E4E7036|nr:hypothetical protein [Mycolicibacterium mageritense]